MIARLALALVAVALFPAAARAATFTVTTASDGAATCTVVTCTLRAALDAANTTSPTEDDVIVVPAGTYVLSTQLGGLTVNGGQRIAFRGAGANSTVVLPQTGGSFRLLAIDGAAQVGISDLTLRGGIVTSGTGGNLNIAGGANVTLDRVRVAGGRAQQGGGIAIGAGAAGTALTIRQSLIDGNSAPGSTAAAAGGGLYIAGSTDAIAVTVTDSTFFNNQAGNGGAVAVTNNFASPPAFRGVTVAGNFARAISPGAGIGGVYTDSARPSFQGSILTRNTTTVNGGQGPITGPANCGIANGGAIDGGGNVTPDTDQCNLGGVHTDPQLDLVPDETLQPPAMKIPANSSAVDAADCGGRTLDQRGVARPQLTTCDAGAFEYQPPPPEPTPTATPVVTPTATPVVTPTPTPTPTPVRNTSVGAQPVRGTVLVKLPGTTRFVPLAPSVIRNGAEVDARQGRVEITTSSGEKATFYDGIFKVSQRAGLTTLTLTEKLAPCPRGKQARAAAKKPKTRKLWGNGKGKFRTKGQYSAATIRGTRWLVQDGCRYTRTTVAVGSVSVRDDVLKKTIVVRKGKSYTARPRR